MPTQRTIEALINATTGLTRDGQNMSASVLRDVIVSMLYGGPRSGRLTLSSGVPVPTSNLTGISNLYFTPFQGNLQWVWNGTIWQPFFFNELSVALSGLTSGKNYDVFGINSSDALALSVGPAWTNDTTRATAISQKDGIYVNSAQYTPAIGGGTVAQYQGTYLGTFRTTGTTTTEDSATKRFLWNNYNRRKRLCYVDDFAGMFTTSATTIVAWRGDATKALQWVDGLGEDTTALNHQTSFIPPGTGSQAALSGFGTVTSGITRYIAVYSTTGSNMACLVWNLNPPDIGPGYKVYYVTHSATGTGNTSWYSMTASAELLA